VDSSSAQAHVLLGEVALAQKNYAEALLEFERGVLQEPRSREALDGLVRVYRKGAISRGMLRNMEQIAGEKPPSATLMEIAGRLYAEHDWHADAERCFRRTLSIDPKRATAAAALAQLFAARGDTAAAAQSARRMGGKTAALVSGLSAQDRNDAQAAITEYETAVREGEHSGIAANNLAWLYAQQGTSLDRALMLAEQARTLAPDNAAVLDTVGVVHLRRREYSQAMEVLKQALASASARALAGQPELGKQIRKHLAEAYLRAGIPQDAQVVAQAAHLKRQRRGTE
jgi:tetratricopeptide (TPR) repeat protein